MTITLSQNTSTKRLSDRLQAELKILEKVAPQITVGLKTVEQIQYTAILIKGVSLSSEKFKVTKTDLLFLLPPEYPRLPPIGCYLNYPWKTVGQGDHHFTQQSHYGAPFLSNEGWYWYCIGLGGGFNQNKWLNAWRPAKDPDKGHNLVTLFITAFYAINDKD